MSISFLIKSNKLLMVFFMQKTFELSIKQTFWNHSYCYFFFIAMQFQKVSLTEPYDIAIALRYVEKESLSDDLKYRILKTHFQPDGNFTFPKTYLHRCNRSCSLNYLHNLFVYSISSDSVFCIRCALFVYSGNQKP